MRFFSRTVRTASACAWTLAFSPSIAAASGLDGAHRAWTVHGDQAGAAFGAAVSQAGDVNGDGFPDVIVGAPNHDGAAGPGCGKVFVYYGSPSGLPSEPSWSAEGEQAGSHFGQNVAVAGDVNGDGFADIVVSAPGYDVGTDRSEQDAGRVYVFLGSPSGLQAMPAFLGDGAAYDQGYREAIGGAMAHGDFNGDGYADLVAAQYARYVGGAHVYYGSPSGLSIDDSWSFLGLDMGRTLAVADVNRDGFDDLIVTSLDPDLESPPTAIVYYGSPTGLPSSPDPNVPPPGVPPSLTLPLWSNAVNVGDLGRDGFSELLAVVGDPFAAPTVPPADVVPNHVLFRTSASGPAQARELGPVFGIPGSLSALGDVNGDGYADALAREGDLFYIYFGSAQGFDPLASGMGTLPGTSVSPAGDIDRDHIEDVLIGDAPNESASLYRGAKDWDFSVGADIAVQQTVEQDAGDAFVEIVVTNTGTVPVRVRLVDFVPAVFPFAWDCFPVRPLESATGDCVPTASGDLDTVVTFGPGGFITYSLHGIAPMSQPIFNTSSVVLPDWVKDPDLSNNRATTVSGASAGLIFRDGFESGDVSAWSAQTGRGLVVAPSMGLQGEWALDIAAPKIGSAFVEDDTPAGEADYHARFLVDASGFGKPTSTHPQVRCAGTLLSGQSSATRRAPFDILLERGAAGLGLRARATSGPGGHTHQTAFVPMSDARHLVEVAWRRASGPGVSDGQLVLRLDGADAATLTGLANDAAGGIDAVGLGLQAALCLPWAASRSVRVDAFESWRPQ